MQQNGGLADGYFDCPIRLVTSCRTDRCIVSRADDADRAGPSPASVPSPSAASAAAPLSDRNSLRTSSGCAMPPASGRGWFMDRQAQQRDRANQGQSVWCQSWGQP